MKGSPKSKRQTSWDVTSVVKISDEDSKIESEETIEDLRNTLSERDVASPL